MKPICIYHANCDDGFGAAWAVWRKFGDAYDYHPAAHGDRPPPTAGRQIIVADFSYPRDVLIKMADESASLTIFDHHKTAAADLEDLIGSHDKVTGCFDMNRSGARITWDFLNPWDPAPPMIQFIEARDLWRLTPEVDAFTYGLRSYPQDFQVWNDIERRMPAVIQEGLAISRWVKLRIEDMARNAFPLTIDVHVAIAANAPWFFASDLAGYLAEKADVAEFAATYYDNDGYRNFSLRSRNGFDVSAVAKRFGGGGHAASAGFRIPLRKAPLIPKA